MPKTIMVIGAQGMLGWAVKEYFSRVGQKVVAITRSEFDIGRDPLEKLETRFNGVDAVINCTGVVKSMIKKTPVEKVLRVNATFPWNLARLCEIWEIPCIHISTDGVYSGRKGSYTEADFFDAEDLYGMSKQAGEPPNCMVLRTSLIGEEQKTQRSLVEWLRRQRGKAVPGYVNHRWNGVTTTFLAEIIETILTKGRYDQGIYHMFCPEEVTNYDLLQMLNDEYAFGVTVLPIKADDAIDRTLASVHDLSYNVAKKALRMQIAEMKQYSPRSVSLQSLEPLPEELETA